MNDDFAPDELRFAAEIDPLPSEEADGYWKVLIVDDDDFVHKVTTLTLSDFRYENRPVFYLHAYSGVEARKLLDEHPDVAVILLDVVMETENAGLDFARYVRREAGNHFVRIILRTGQPGQAPERTVITEYDINDYKHKAELSEQRLFTAVTTAIRSYRDLRTIDQSRQGLSGVVQTSSWLFGTRSVPDFLASALDGILHTGCCFGESCREYGVVAVMRDGSCSVLHTRGPVPRGAEDGSWLGLLHSLRVEMMGEESLRIHGRHLVARFRNAHTSEEYLFYAVFGRPFTETERHLLHILLGNIGVALGNLFLNEEIVATQREVVLTLGEVVETRSKETAHHVRRVAEYSRLLAFKTGLGEERAELLRMASPMHDVGKIGIPDAILFKPGKLTADEFALIKEHTTIGHAILKNSSRRILRTAATIALQHHEHWNGQGYPQGLCGEQTHVFGRITALADVFDALSSERAYKKAWPLDDILAYIRDQRERQFDPHLTDIFLTHVEDMLAIRAEYPDDQERPGV